MRPMHVCTFFTSPKRYLNVADLASKVTKGARDHQCFIQWHETATVFSTPVIFRGLDNDGATRTKTLRRLLA